MSSVENSIAEMCRGHGSTLLPHRSAHSELLKMRCTAQSVYSNSGSADMTDNSFFALCNKTREICEIAKFVREALQATKDCVGVIEYKHCETILKNLLTICKDEDEKKSARPNYTPKLRLLAALGIERHTKMKADDQLAFAKLLAIAHAADHAATSYIRIRNLVLDNRDGATYCLPGSKYFKRNAAPRSFTEDGYCSLRSCGFTPHKDPKNDYKPQLPNISELHHKKHRKSRENY